MSNEVQTIKSFFDSHQVLLSLEWLESCIQWCKSELLGPNYSITDLQFKVYEQWLLLDLREVELKSLPPNISKQTKYTLTGTYSLQVMKIEDISKPKLWQINKIRNTNALSRNQEKDNEEAGTGKRVLLLTMTDGVQEIQAMEYRPITILNINSRPGIKVRLMGPITVRRGRLMLEPQHIKVLGGEVEELIVCNAAENVLARALGMPENPTPTIIDESILTANKDMFTQGTQNVTNPFTVNNANRINRNIANKGTVPKNPPKPKIVEDDFPNDDEMDDMLNQEIEMMMEAERDMKNSNKSKNIPQKRKTKTPDMFDDDFEDINEEEIIKNAIKIKTSQKNKTIQKPMQSSQTVQEEIQNNFDDLNDLCDDVFGDFNLDVHLEKVEIYDVKKLQELAKSKKFGTYKVKAKFNSIVRKLTVANNELLLIIKIEDSTGDFIVKMDSKIIAGFAGYTPAAFMALKENVTKKDESATLKVIKALKEIKDKLIKLEGTFEIKIDLNETNPILIEIL